MMSQDPSGLTFEVEVVVVVSCLIGARWIWIRCLDLEELTLSHIIEAEHKLCELFTTAENPAGVGLSCSGPLVLRRLQLLA